MAIWDQAKQLHARGQRGEARRLARQAISHRRQARRRFAELVEHEPSFQVPGVAAPHIKRDFSHAWYNPTGYLKPSTEGIRARGSRLASLGNLLRRGGRAASRGAAGLARLYHFLRGDVGKNAAHASKSVVQIDLGNSSGSGLVYRSLTEPNKNLILTNQHVVGSLRKGDMVSVGLARGGRPIAARVRGMSVLADVAVLEPVDPLPRGIRPLRFRRRPVHKGDPVAVVGHPYGGQGDGVDPQVSAGVVSQARPGNLTITDTKTGSGGSGGPVVDRRGRVIGLLTAVRGPKTPQQHGSAYPLIVPNARIMQVLRKVERGVVRHASSGLLVDGLQVAEA
jgi:S1-C subfamily serine protease